LTTNTNVTVRRHKNVIVEPIIVEVGSVGIPKRVLRSKQKRKKKRSKRKRKRKRKKVHHRPRTRKMSPP
jgi:hypothetical protein